jgi:hypothetical protein
MDRHPDVVEQRREDDDDLGIVAREPVVALERRLPLHELTQESGDVATIWMCTTSGR